MIGIGLGITRGGAVPAPNPELVTNGTFDAGSDGWTTSGTGTPDFSGGTFAFTGASSLLATSDGEVAVGITYEYSYDITTAVTGGFVQLLIGGAATGGQVDVGTYTGTIAAASNTLIRIQAFGDGAVDNISVKRA